MKKHIQAVFFTILMSFGTAAAQEPLPERSKPESSIPYSYQVIEGIGGIYEEFGSDPAMDMVFDILKKDAPNENHIFAWKDGDFHIAVDEITYVFSSFDTCSSFLVDANSRVLHQEQIVGDASTFASYSPISNKTAILVMVPFDKIFFDESQNERKVLDPLARLIVAIAHETFGNVSYYLNMTKEEQLLKMHPNRLSALMEQLEQQEQVFMMSDDERSAYTSKMTEYEKEDLYNLLSINFDKEQVENHLMMSEDEREVMLEELRIKMEVNAFTQGVEFIERLLHRLPEGEPKVQTLIDGLKQALVFEQQGLAYWKNYKK